MYLDGGFWPAGGTEKRQPRVLSGRGFCFLPGWVSQGVIEVGVLCAHPVAQVSVCLAAPRRFCVALPLGWPAHAGFSKEGDDALKAANFFFTQISNEKSLTYRGLQGGGSAVRSLCASCPCGFVRFAWLGQVLCH